MSARTFPCPNCNEIINDSTTQCRFCSTPIDPGVAQLIADKQAKVNQACSDASFLRTTAIAMYVFLGLSFIPILPFVEWAFVILFVMVIVLLIRWQVKFSGLVTNDIDYQKARRSWLISLVLLIVAVPLGFIVRPLIFFLILGPRG